MRGRRCVSCGERFYAAPGDTSTECQTCTGGYDPSAQAISDTANIEAVNDIRNLTTGKQTLDIKALANATEAPKKSRKVSDDAPST